MAYYLVKAKPNRQRIEKLSKELERNAFLSVKPFGESLSYSLINARLRDDGYAVWEEEDYCTPPLAQERAAVLDAFFDDLTVERVKKGQGWNAIEALPRLFSQLGRIL